MSLDQNRDVLLRDANPDFLEAAARDLAWRYAQLFEDINADPGVPVICREAEFNRRRGDCAVKSLVRAAERHGVPYEFRRLECNGQHKLLIKCGRVILIQEPIRTLLDHPAAADYKQELAALYGFSRQLELDLGDQPRRILDWSDTVLAVMLHGAAGGRFTQEHKALGAVMIALPDAAYKRWDLRLDLHEVAMFGRGFGDVQIGDEQSNEAIEQVDRVIVKPKVKLVKYKA